MTIMAIAPTAALIGTNPRRCKRTRAADAPKLTDSILPLICLERMSDVFEGELYEEVKFGGAATAGMIIGAGRTGSLTKKG